MTKSTALLTFAVLSTIAFAQEGPSWTAKPGKGVSFKDGDSFGLTISGQLQANWSFAANELDADVNTFNVPRARLFFRGHAFNPNLLYHLQLDAADSGSARGGAIKEGWAQWNFHTGEYTLGLRMGQTKTQYGFEGTGTSAGTFFVETSAATRAFANAYSRGAWLMGSGMENKLRWSAGAMNTDTASGIDGSYTDVGEEGANSDNELSYVLTANFDPLGALFEGDNQSFRQGDFRTDDKSLKGTIGVGLGLGNGRDATAGEDVDSMALNLNTVWSIEGFQIMGEYFMRTDELQGATKDEEEPSGFYLSGTYVMPKSGDSKIQWGFGARFGMIETDIGNNATVNYITKGRGIGDLDGDATEITLIANAFYHGHAAKTQIEYTWQDVDATGNRDDATNHIFTVAFQLCF